MRKLISFAFMLAGALSLNSVMATDSAAALVKQDKISPDHAYFSDVANSVSQEQLVAWHYSHSSHSSHSSHYSHYSSRY